MATPNMPSSAQDIINNFLSGGYASQAIANPYRVDVDPFRPPVSDTPEDDKSPTDPCPEGYIYDPVIKSCVPIEQESGDRPDEPDREKMMFEQMKKDPSTVFGASNILDDYLIDTKGGGDILLKFDPNIGKLGAGGINPLMVLGGGLLDSVFGGPKRREDRFNDALQTFTDSGYGQQLNNGTYQVFNPQQYYNTVQGNPLGSYQLTTSGGYSGIPQTYGVQTSPITVGQAVESVMNPQPQQGTSSGSPIATDMSGGLLGRTPLTTKDSSGNITGRDDTAYKASVARNIERNKRNFGNARFKEGFGFTGGR